VPFPAIRFKQGSLNSN